MNGVKLKTQSQKRKEPLLSEVQDIYAAPKASRSKLNSTDHASVPGVEMEPINTSLAISDNRDNLTNQDALLTTRDQKELSMMSTPSIAKSSVDKKNNSGSRIKALPLKKQKTYVNWNYEITNLTMTLYNWGQARKLFVLIYIASLIVRLYTFLFLVFVLVVGIKDRDFMRWEWLIALGTARVLFILVVLFTGLSLAEGNLHTILKNCWNPNSQQTIHQLFERVTFQSFVSCFKKAITPPQLAFVYLIGDNTNRKTALYMVINYIFLSIETVIFYPFVIMYSLLVLNKEFDLVAYKVYTYLSIVIAIAWISTFLGFSGYLFIRGLVIKFQKQD